jgi:hypothetical protein
VPIHRLSLRSRLKARLQRRLKPPLQRALAQWRS